MSTPPRAGTIQSSGLGSGCLVKVAAAGCLLMLLGYGVLWSGTVQSRGGAENYVRRIPFLATLTAATIVAGPQPARLYDPAAQEAAQAAVLGADNPAVPLVPYTDPPFAAVLLAPLLRAGLHSSLLFTAWAMLTTGAAGLSIGLLAGRWPAQGGTPWLLMLAATSFLPLISALMLGQNSMLALLGWVGLGVGLKGGRDGPAGIAGALAALQPQALPLLVLVLVLARRPRALGALALTLALGALAVSPVLGLAWPVTYAGWLFQLLRLPDAPTAGALLVAGAILLGTWLPRDAAGRAPDTTGALAWDRRWALTGLAALLALGALQANNLPLAILPGWIIAAHLANGQLPAGQRGFWRVWLGLGYALGPAIILLSPAFIWGGLLWWAAAVGVLAWNLAARPVLSEG